MENNLRQEFLLAEYGALRNEILEMIKDGPQNQRLALLINGVFWAWITLNARSVPYVYISVWVPLALTALFYLREKALSIKTKALHSYLLQVESQFDLGGLGWETYIETKGRSWVSGSVEVFWGSLIAGNLAFIAVTLYSSYA